MSNTEQGNEQGEIVSVRMPKIMKTQLDDYAKARGCSRSKLIITALADKLGLDQMIDPWSES